MMSWTAEEAAAVKGECLSCSHNTDEQVLLFNTTQSKYVSIGRGEFPLLGINKESIHLSIILIVTVILYL